MTLPQGVCRVAKARLGKGEGEEDGIVLIVFQYV